MTKQEKILVFKETRFQEGEQSQFSGVLESNKAVHKNVGQSSGLNVSS